MVVAAEILSRSGLDPVEVGEQLDQIDPNEVPISRIPFWLDLILPSWIGAMTIADTIWIRPRVLAMGGEKLGRLVLHELVHVRQWREHGVLGFLRHYLGDYLRARVRDRSGHRAAYHSIPFEDEAYTVAADIDATSAT